MCIRDRVYTQLVMGVTDALQAASDRCALVDSPQSQTRAVVRERDPCGCAVADSSVIRHGNYPVFGRSVNSSQTSFWSCAHGS